MTELIERSFAVVIAVTRRTGTAERQSIDSKVQQGVTLNASAGTSVVEEVVLDLLVAGKEVEGKRLVARVDELDSSLDVLDRDDGKKGAKDLTGHDGIINLDIGDDGGWQVLGVLITFTAKDDVALGSGKHGIETLPVTTVDDAGVALGVVDTAVVLRVETLVGLFEFGNEAVLKLVGDQDVVGSDTGLTTVEGFAPQNTVGGDAEIGTLVNVDGRLATKLKSGRAEPLGSLLGNDATDSAVTSVEDVLEALVKDSGSLGDTTVDDAVAFGVEVLVPKLRKQLGSVASYLGRLEDNSVTGSDGTNDGTNLDSDGVIPSTEDEDGTLGFGTNLGTVHGPRSTGPWLLRLGPLVELVKGFYDLVCGTGELCKDGLESGTAEILTKSFNKVLLVVLEHESELLELILSVLDGASLAGQEGGAEVGVDLWDFIDRGVLKTRFSGGGSGSSHDEY